MLSNPLFHDGGDTLVIFLLVAHSSTILSHWSSYFSSTVDPHSSESIKEASSLHTIDPGYLYCYSTEIHQRAFGTPNTFYLRSPFALKLLFIAYPSKQPFTTDILQHSKKSALTEGLLLISKDGFNRWTIEALKQGRFALCYSSLHLIQSFLISLFYWCLGLLLLTWLIHILP